MSLRTCKEALSSVVIEYFSLSLFARFKAGEILARKEFNIYYATKAVRITIIFGIL